MTSDGGTEDVRGVAHDAGMPSRATLGVLAGCVAGAMTAGALAGFGIGDGGPARHFAAIGRHVLGGPVIGAGTEHAAVAAVGLVTFLALVIALGAAFGAIAARARGWRLAALAIGASLLAATVHALMAPGMWRGGNGVTVLALQRSELAALYLLLALGLGLGMRVALLCARLDEPLR